MTSQKVITRLVYWLPKIFGELLLTRNRCILATAVGLDVLARFNVQAEPRSVLCAISNEAWHRYWIEGQKLSLFDVARGTRVLTLAETSLQPPDAWSVWAGAVEDDPSVITASGWLGHLVIYVPGKALMLDLDAQAFSRPAKGIHVPRALVLPWALDEERIDFEGSLRGGGSIFVHYERADANQAFIVAKDWTHRRPELVDLVERAIRKG